MATQPNILASPSQKTFAEPTTGLGCSVTPPAPGGTESGTWSVVMWCLPFVQFFLSGVSMLETVDLASNLVPGFRADGSSRFD